MGVRKRRGLDDQKESGEIEKIEPSQFSLAACELCEQFECLSLTKDDATSAAALRREYGLRLPDAFHAAVAVRNGLKLVTRDARDFDEKKHAFVLIPFRVE